MIISSRIVHFELNKQKKIIKITQDKDIIKLSKNKIIIIIFNCFNTIDQITFLIFSAIKRLLNHLKIKKQ